MMGTAIAFHYVTRVVNVLLDEHLVALPPVLQPLTGIVHRLGAATVGTRLTAKIAEPGESLTFLPQAEMPVEFSWAEADQVVGEAFAGFASIVEQAGEEAVPGRVRTMVGQHLQTWEFENPGISRRWVDDLVGILDPAERTSARLALLTAVASYQVDEHVVSDFRAHHPSDAELIATVAWASFAAARRISSRLGKVAA